MRIRADFFIGQDESADWIDSLLYNGDKEALPYSLLSSTTAEQFKQEVYQLFMTMKLNKLSSISGWLTTVFQSPVHTWKHATLRLMVLF